MHYQRHRCSGCLGWHGWLLAGKEHDQPDRERDREYCKRGLLLFALAHCYFMPGESAIPGDDSLTSAAAVAVIQEQHP
jgi:hypothetical protein